MAAAASHESQMEGPPGEKQGSPERLRKGTNDGVGLASWS